ncbi:hypothetical protein LINPERHAP2_LOCUS6793 [Linum perenne]
MFTDEEVRTFYQPWSKALVVKVLEGSFALATMKRRLEGLWARTGRIQVSDTANNFFLVRFSTSDDYDRAAFGGPCKVAVTRIGNAIGRTIRLDLATSEGARARFARVCVEVDLTKPLLGKYMIEDMVFFIEYESLENICTSCGVYAHKKEACPSLHPVTQADTVETRASTPLAGSGAEEAAGSWMIVGRRKKKPIENTRKGPVIPAPQGSRFDILSTDEELIGEKPLNSNKSKSPTLEERASNSGPDNYDYAAAAFLSAMQKSKGGITDPMNHGKADKAGTLPREPLKDISNDHPMSSKSNSNVSNPSSVKKAQRSNQKLTPGNGPELISIPVSYHNPIFQINPSSETAALASAPSRVKNRSNKTKAPPPVKKVVEPVRKFTLKKAGQQLTSKSKGTPSQDKHEESIIAGDPPDQVC